MKLEVRLSKSADYLIPRNDLIESVKNELIRLGLKNNAEVNISFVDEKTMVGIAELYLNEKNKVHNVLSFPSTEVKAPFEYPEGVSQLGDIVICYKKAVEESRLEGVAIKKKLIDLATHGARHLMGKHHK